MSTILTDDEMIAAVGAPAYLEAGRAVEAAVLAKLAQQEPVAGVVLTPSWGGKTRPALVDEGDEQWHCANRGATRLYAHPAPQQADRQRVPDEPDWQHPKIQSLIGADARNRICIDLVWRILEDPRREFTASDMEYWDKLHDKVQEVSLAAAPEAPAQASAVDERAEFEAWVTELGVAMHYEGDGHYGNATVARWWEAWQARAALAQKGGK